VPPLIELSAAAWLGSRGMGAAMQVFLGKAWTHKQATLQGLPCSARKPHALHLGAAGDCRALPCTYTQIYTKWAGAATLKSLD
jgi:hypothetical protein